MGQYPTEEAVGGRTPIVAAVPVGETEGEKKRQEQTTGNLETAKALREAYVGGIDAENAARERSAASLEKETGEQSKSAAVMQASSESMGEAIVANSEEAQAAGRSFYELGAQVDIAKIAMDKANLAAKEAAVSQIDVTEATNKAMAEEANWTFLKNQQTEAQKKYQQEMNESLLTLQKNQEQQAARVKTVSTPVSPAIVTGTLRNLQPRKIWQPLTTRLQLQHNVSQLRSNRQQLHKNKLG